MARSSLWILGGIFMIFAGLTHGQLEDEDEDMVVRTSMVTGPVSAVEFFIDRGWTPNGDEAVSEIIDLVTYIQLFQEYAGLPVSGDLDDATKAKMNSPICGNRDFGPSGFTIETSRRKRFTTLGTTWPQNDITWYLQGVTVDLQEVTIRSELAAAFQFWADVSALSFQEVFTDDADVIVDFFIRDHGDGNTFDGPGRVLAHAFSPGRGRGGDMHFDDDEVFTASTGTNLQQVAVHEIGHSLGLGHSSDQNAIMAAFYSYRQNFRLGDDDVRGIQSLYGPPTSNPVTRPPIPVTQPTVTATTTPTPPRSLPMIFCNGEFDATVESFDNNVYLFQGDMVFKILQDFTIAKGYPKPIATEFPGLPDFVDAAFLWEISSVQKYIYIFKGSLYWRFYNGAASAGYPRPISVWGIPSNIDGAYRWSGNRLIYFFKDNLYYRYNTMSFRIDAGYPQPISRWPNVDFPVTAVLNWNGQSYFFNGQYFQIFFDGVYKAAGSVPAARTWLGCRTEGLQEATTPTSPNDDDDDNSGGVSVAPFFYVSIVTSFLSVWLHRSF